MKNNLSKSESLLLRCDASSRIGYGHIMRCIAIAQAAKIQNVRTIFLVSEFSQKAINLLMSNRFEFHIIDKSFNKDDLFHTILISKEINTKNIILDISNVITIENSEYYSKYIYALLKNNFNVSIIDSTGEESISLKYYFRNAKIFLPYLMPEKELVKYSQYNFFASLKYFPIREEFIKSKKTTNINKIKNIMICLSGTDVMAETEKILSAINRFNDYRLNITIIGVMENIIKSHHRIRYLESSNTIAQEMANSQLIIIGSGLIRYEAAFMECPSLIFSLLPEHNRMVEYFSSHGTSIYGGEIKKLTLDQIFKLFSSIIKNPEKLKNISINCKNMIDSEGASRILNSAIK
tara:strand:+ start:203 stop:1252 length:1050 start_codon:yes stop_codon:yes gene_type:complete